MTYIENIYACLAAPLLVAILCMRREGRRSLLFVLAGMTTCLLSAYVSTFVTGIAGVDRATASFEITPVVEELMKLLPMAFFLLIFEPEREITIGGTMMVSVGFATFENVCFLSSYGSSDLLRLLVRGFGTGAMHVVCGVVVAMGLYFLWNQTWLRTVGVFALLCFVITFHAIFNILVSQSGFVFWIGSAIPLTVVLFYLIFLAPRVASSR